MEKPLVKTNIRPLLVVCHIFGKVKKHLFKHILLKRELVIWYLPFVPFKIQIRLKLVSARLGKIQENVFFHHDVLIKPALPRYFKVSNFHHDSFYDLIHTWRFIQKMFWNDWKKYGYAFTCIFFLEFCHITFVNEDTYFNAASITLFSFIFARFIYVYSINSYIIIFFSNV